MNKEEYYIRSVKQIINDNEINEAVNNTKNLIIDNLKYLSIIANDLKNLDIDEITDEGENLSSKIINKSYVGENHIITNHEFDHQIIDHQITSTSIWDNNLILNKIKQYFNTFNFNINDMDLNLYNEINLNLLKIVNVDTTIFNPLTKNKLNDNKFSKIYLKDDFKNAIIDNVICLEFDKLYSEILNNLNLTYNYPEFSKLYNLILNNEFDDNSKHIVNIWLNYLYGALKNNRSLIQCEEDHINLINSSVSYIKDKLKYSFDNIFYIDNNKLYFTNLNDIEKNKLYDIISQLNIQFKLSSNITNYNKMLVIDEKKWLIFDKNNLVILSKNLKF